ncbi:MAG: pilus assembly protein PilM [Burkholderiales bacterium]
MIKEKFVSVFKKRVPLIGLDITSSSVKVVELESSGKNGYLIEHYAIEPLPRDAVVDGNIMNLEAVSECVKRAWVKSGSHIREVAVALPTAAVITKKIVMPAGLREDEMESQVETEANQYIPFALDEVNLDFQVLGPTANSPDDVDVLIAAARKDKVEDRVAAAQAAGLKALVMDVESFAAEAAFMLLQQQLGNVAGQTVALLDLGATMIKLYVMRDAQMLYTREQPFGGNLLTLEIQRHFNLSPEEAEAAKRGGGLPDNYQSEVLHPFTETLAMEVARALQFFFTSTQYNQVNQLVLAGGCAMIPGLSKIVEERVQVPAVIANSFAKMAGAKAQARNLSMYASSLITACGLAIRRFDPK